MPARLSIEAKRAKFLAELEKLDMEEQGQAGKDLEKVNAKLTILTDKYEDLGSKIADLTSQRDKLAAQLQAESDADQS